MAAIALAAGRRSKFLVLAVFVLLGFGLSSQAGKLGDVQSEDVAASLPDGAESLAALEAAEAFPAGETIPAVVVFHREAGLTRADRRAIEQVRRDVPRDRVAFPVPEPQVSEDGTGALLTVPLRDTGDEAATERAVEDLRSGLPDGLPAAVTGAAAFDVDISNVFEGVDGALLAITGGLVFVLLLLIYRSPIFWVLPLFTVVLAEGSSRGVGYLLGDAGLTITGQSAGILSVLVFGATTDYALLLVARYREELRRRRDKHDAMRVALRGTAPAILASGGTVIAGLLTLSLADVGSTQAIGPLGAAGIALALTFSLTVLPATLVLAGRRAFWPAVPHHGSDDAAHKGAYARLGERIGRRARPVWVTATVVLLLLAGGLANLDTGLTQQQSFTEDVEAIEGQRLLAKAFPPGLAAPATVVAEDAGVARALEQSDLVVSARPVETGPDGALLTVVLAGDPYDAETVARIPDVRALAPDALVGGQTAEAHDLRDAAQRDNLLVPPLTLLVVVVILVIVLRALVAPLLLLLSVVVSFAAALGAGALGWDLVFGYPATDATVPLLAFVFLVALGVDYNIFLAARAREERERHGARRGILLALAATGGVITAAGVVLAGTFSALAVLPLVILTQLGSVVAFGVLLDTLLVRSVLVPALLHDLGERAWWPSRRRPDSGGERSTGLPEWAGSPSSGSTETSTER